MGNIDLLTLALTTSSCCDVSSQFPFNSYYLPRIQVNRINEKRSIKMASTQFYLLSLIVAFLFLTVIAEPLPEGEPESVAESEPESQPEAGAASEPEGNSASVSQGHIVTAFVSFLAYVLLK